MLEEIDNQLYELQKACNRYKETDCLADWVLFAVNRHIITRRATRAFEKAFVEFDKEKFPELIKACLNGDKSDDGIIKTCNRIFNRRKSK